MKYNNIAQILEQIWIIILAVVYGNISMLMYNSIMPWSLLYIITVHEVFTGGYYFIVITLSQILYSVPSLSASSRCLNTITDVLCKQDSQTMTKQTFAILICYSMYIITLYACVYMCVCVWVASQYASLV